MERILLQFWCTVYSEQLKIYRPNTDILRGRPLSFDPVSCKLKINTPITSAPQSVHTNFGSSTPLVF